MPQLLNQRTSHTIIMGFWGGGGGGGGGYPWKQISPKLVIELAMQSTELSAHCKDTASVYVHVQIFSYIKLLVTPLSFLHYCFVS
jgi:hypothetical protein